MAEYGSATWKVSLWLCNDQGVYEDLRAFLRDDTSMEEAFYLIVFDQMEDSMGKDIFRDLLGLVDWNEIESDLKGDDWSDEDEEEDDDE